MTVEKVFIMYEGGALTKLGAAELIASIVTADNVDSVMQHVPAAFYDALRIIGRRNPDAPIVEIGSPPEVTREAIESLRGWFACRGL